MAKRIITAMLLLGLFGAFSSAAQVTELDRSRLSTAAFYSYSEPGDVTIRVHVWGAVRYPGLYEIPRGSKLSELVSLSGGPTVGERAKKSTRTVELKLHRNDGNMRQVIYQTTMQNEIVVRTEDPVLQADDVLSYEAVLKQGFQWRDVFPIVSMVGTIVLIADRITAK
jgi:hypothetical protein